MPTLIAVCVALGAFLGCGPGEPGSDGAVNGFDSFVPPDSTPGVDSGPVPTDSGGDSGPGTDAGMPGTDATMPGTDAATPGTDMGSPGTDGGFDDGTPLDLTSGAPRVSVVTAGQPAVDMVIDTGSPVNVLDTDYFPGGPGVATANFNMFGSSFPNQPAVRYNWFGSPPPGAAISAAGNIGGEFLIGRSIVIDYRFWLGYLYSNLTGDANVQANVGPSVVVPFSRLGGGTFSIPGDGNTTASATRLIFSGTIEGTPATIMLDTGASISVIRENFFNNLGDPTRPTLDGVNVGMSGGVVQATVSRVSIININGATVNGETVIIIPGTSLFSGIGAEVGMTIDLLLGGSYLRHFLTTVNYDDSELRLAPYAFTDHINLDEWRKPGIEVTDAIGGGFVISDVYAGTDAEAAGLMEGVDIATINGMNPNSMSLQQFREYLTGFATGSTVDIEVQIGMFTMVFPVLSENLLPAYP